MLNPLLNYNLNQNSIMFFNKYDRNNIVGKLNISSKSQGHHLLQFIESTTKDRNKIIIGIDKYNILNDIISIIKDGEIFYEYSFLYSNIFEKFECCNFRVIGAPIVGINDLSMIGGGNENMINHYIINYIHSADLLEKLLEIDVRSNDTIFLYCQKECKTAFIGPMIVVDKEFDKYTFIKNVMRKSKIRKLESNLLNDILRKEYLSSLVDYLTSFHTNLSNIWGRKLVTSERKLLISELLY